MEKESIAVWFSCGAASAVAAKLTLDKYAKTHIVRIVNNPVAEEDEDNKRFLQDVSAWLGKEIEVAASSKYPSASAKEVWSRRRFMSGPNGAPCTVELKKKARQEWEKANPVEWHVLGFTADELVRHQRFVLTERSNLLPVLIDAGLTKQDCYRILQDANVKPPRIYELGYPNANCIGCVKATSPTYWNLVRRVHPEVFADRADQSRQLGVKLTRYKGQRMFLDELPDNARGRSMRSLDFECGIFCEEREATKWITA
jgi:hypothetical protein